MQWFRFYSLLRRLTTMASEHKPNNLQQVTNRVMMIRPRSFGFNEQTAGDNAFQIDPTKSNGSYLTDPEQVRKLAIVEFERLLSLLKSCGIQVHEELDRDDLKLPDSVFPNNWISFHSPLAQDTPSKIALYPMMANTRRNERQDTLIRKWTESLQAEVLDLTYFENNKLFLEGTGSMVIDRVNRIVYSCLSARTHEDPLKTFCHELNYTPVIFNATQKSSLGNYVPIYHTNVMLCLGEEFAMICLDSIRNESERIMVKNSIEKSGKEVIPITELQLNNFVCNSLQLCNKNGKRYVVMSTKSYEALKDWQKEKILESSEIAHCPVDVIEALGGGGVRCMIAEIFPPL